MLGIFIFLLRMTYTNSRKLFFIAVRNGFKTYNRPNNSVLQQTGNVSPLFKSMRENVSVENWNKCNASKKIISQYWLSTFFFLNKTVHITTGNMIMSTTSQYSFFTIVYGRMLCLSTVLRSLWLGFCSTKGGGRWYTIDAALIKIPAVKPHIMYFLLLVS